MKLLSIFLFLLFIHPVNANNLKPLPEAKLLRGRSCVELGESHTDRLVNRLLRDTNTELQRIKRNINSLDEKFRKVHEEVVRYKMQLSRTGN